MQEDFLELAEDMSEVDTFFRVQRSIFDNARSQVERVNEEKEYFQTEDNTLAVVEKIKQIIATQKPYKRISELPELIQTVQEDYQKLLSQKREEVIGEIQAAMGEIHQTADIKQGDIVQRADDALTEKRTATENADKLINIRQQYLQKLVVVDEPDIDTVTMSRSAVCHTMKLQSEADIDEYIAEVKRTLMDKLNGHDVLHII